MRINEVIDAKDPVEACVLISQKKATISAGLHWKVSEIGFENHPEDIYISDEKINRELKKRGC